MLKKILIGVISTALMAAVALSIKTLYETGGRNVLPGVGTPEWVSKAFLSNKASVSEEDAAEEDASK